MREISRKNYFIYAGLCFISMILLFIVSNNFRNSLRVDDSTLNEVLYEINSNNIFSNIKNYAVDNPEFFLYISNSYNKDFDASFKSYVTDNEFDSIIIYFNGWNKLDDDFVKKFKNHFFNKSLSNINENVIKQSNIYFFNNGKVVDVLYRKKVEINIDDVKKFIEGFDNI